MFLVDGLPEFSRAVLEALRQPLEDGFVTGSRVGGAALFPAAFRLVGTPAEMALVTGRRSCYVAHALGVG